MSRRSPDLWIALLVVVLTLYAGLSGMRSANIEYETLPLWMAPFGILMVLFIPGYAITSALLPKVGSEKTLLLALGMSISLSAIGGVLLNLTPWGLTPATWSVWLGSISLAGLGFAFHQRRKHAREFDMGVPVMHRENLAIFVWAGFILVGAVVIAYTSSRQAETTFTQLWAVPAITSEGSYEIQVGVLNKEKQPEIYNVYIEMDGRQLEQWPAIPLESNDEWTATLQLPEKPGETIRISLYRGDESNTVYRWLRVSPEAFKQQASDELIQHPQP